MHAGLTRNALFPTTQGVTKDISIGGHTFDTILITLNHIIGLTHLDVWVFFGPFERHQYEFSSLVVVRGEEGSGVG